LLKKISPQPQNNKNEDLLRRGKMKVIFNDKKKSNKDNEEEAEKEEEEEAINLRNKSNFIYLSNPQ
jgi:hypothetical protein